MTSEVYCVFERQSDGTCECVRGNCGMKLPAKIDCRRARYVCRGGRPGFVRRGRNYAEAVATEVVHLATRPRTPEEIAEIQAVCRSNPCGLYNAEGDWCEHRDCGCSVKHKPTYKMQKCPMGFWKEVGRK